MALEALEIFQHLAGGGVSLVWINLQRVMEDALDVASARGGDSAEGREVR